MFGKLKDKLKNWVSKNEEKPEEEELLEETVKKEEKKKTSKKTKKKAESTKKIKKSKPKEKLKEEPVKKPKEKVEEEIEEKPKEKKSFFSKFKKIEKPEEKTEEELEEGGLEKEKSKKKIGLFRKELSEEKFEELFSELQIILLQHNCAYEAVESIENHLKKSLVGKPTKEIDLTKSLKEAIENLLIDPPNFLEEIKKSEKPFVILFAGINGSGKTTTIAKIANYLQKNNLSILLAAADTFRAAAIQQLEVHANNLKTPIIKKDYGSDPASVGFDAIKYAKKKKIDVVLIDTAGRMQNSDTLMKEIEKISRVTSPNMKIFLGESTTGNDATLQAKAFNDSIGLTGIILSKADVDESGGTAISVSHVAKVPILFLGTGQNYEDLEPFKKDTLLKKIFS